MVIAMSEQARLLPYDFANTHGVLLDKGEVLYRQSPSVTLLAELNRVIKHDFALQAISAQDFQMRLASLYQSGADAAQRAADEMGDEEDLASLMDDIPANSDLLSDADNAPVIRLINALLAQAVREKASDVHVEPFENQLFVRFRVDGVLRDVLSPKPELGKVLVSRLKVMAKLDIAEKRLPQDGRIRVKLAGHQVDIRMSTIPSSFGERVVLRILDQSAGQLTLDQLDMPEAVYRHYAKALARPHGIVLVTGPTGSGKTTTLYAGLQQINERQRNIMTIEDPVEYVLPGIGQTQVNSRVDMTFARGLRAILRQDPDVVMVGEIRDRETAEIAVQASLTGHLVLSTLHTNTAIGALMRLQDMGVEPFLLASSVQVIIAQRLVRRLCQSCCQPVTVDAAMQQLTGLPVGETVYQAQGCDHCNHSGYKGRTGIYEVLVINDEIRRMIHQRADEQDMLSALRQQHDSIEAHGRQRILSGQTSVDEVLRVSAMQGGDHGDI